MQTPLPTLEFLQPHNYLLKYICNRVVSTEHLGFLSHRLGLAHLRQSVLTGLVPCVLQGVVPTGERIHSADAKAAKFYWRVAATLVLVGHVCTGLREG